jgi:murein DD-endopeptidase MepM/ murein hydrolase activator NlpD
MELLHTGELGILFCWRSGIIMGWKRLTFILIPHYQSTIKQFRVHRTVIYSLTFFLVLAVGIMFFYIIGFNGKTRYNIKTRELTTQNAILEKNLTLLDSTLSRVSVKISMIDSLNQVILKESNVSDRDLKTSGPEKSTQKSGHFLSPEKLFQAIDRLDRESRADEINSGVLYKAFLNHAGFLRGVPSIRPADGQILKEFGYSEDEYTGRKKLHDGVRIYNVEGTPVIASADGVVTKVVMNATDENGLYVVIDHNSVYETMYAHLQQHILVRDGERVIRGQHIGFMGRTGIAVITEAPHLLYKVKYHGAFVDPALYFFAPDFSELAEKNALSKIQEPRSVY